MIFYVALDAEGKHHLVTTQAEAGKINKTYETIDIPTDRAGILGVVRGLLDQVDSLTGQVNSLKHDASIAPVTISVEADEDKAVAEFTARAATKALTKPVTVTVPITHLSIMEWLLDTATQAQVEQVFSAIGARWGEAR